MLLWHVEHLLLTYFQSDFNTDSDVDCINLKVYSLPRRQFNSRKKITISSISASLPQSGLSDQFRYVKNKNVAAVGEMISDGVKLELTVTALSGLYACIPLPTVSNSTVAPMSSGCRFSKKAGQQRPNSIVGYCARLVSGRSSVRIRVRPVSFLLFARSCTNLFSSPTLR